jgi:hypothetical protein
MIRLGLLVVVVVRLLITTIILHLKLFAAIILQCREVQKDWQAGNFNDSTIIIIIIDIHKAASLLEGRW